MNKRILALLLVCALIVSAFAACSTTPAEQPTDNGEAVVTDVPATEAVTDEPTAEITAEPTEEPTEAPTEEPKATMDLGGLDAIFVDLEGGSYSTVATILEYDEVWLNIYTDIGDNWVLFNFDEPFAKEDYPYIAFKYRLGFAQSIRNTNHFYSVTDVSGGPAGTEGMWSDITWISDCDWHVGTLDLAAQFPAAEGKWLSIRFPSVDALNGDMSIAWIGAFKSEEDIAKYDELFNASYGDKLVKAEEPAEEQKEEEVPDFESEFDETLLDFEDYSDGDGMAPGGYDYYNFCVGANKSNMVETNGTIAAKLGFDAFYYDGLVKSGAAYTATFDALHDGGDSNFAGFIFNWGNEGNLNRNFYENNGLEGDGMGSLVSASGCGVFFLNETQIKVYIPIWDIENNKKSYISATIDTGINLKTDFVHFKIEDNGTDTVTVSANETVLFMVKYSNPGVVNKALGYYESYYRTVSLTDGTGTELASAADGALFSIYKSVAWAGRAHTIIIDNLKIVNNK